MPDFDVVVVGGGHNGLVCGAYLAKAGLKVCVVERRPVIGGACVTEELWPGFRASTAAYNFTLLQPKIMLDLDLARHGLEILPVPPVFQPFPDGRTMTLWDDTSRLASELAQFSARDAERYPAYLAHLRSLAPIIRAMMWETPPDLAFPSWRDRLDALAFAWRSRSVLARAADLTDLLTMRADDYLRRWFSDDDAIAVLGFYVAMAGSLIGLSTPGSAFALIRPMIRDNTTAAGGWGVPRGGMGSVADAIARAGAAAGMQVMAGDPVREITLRGGRAEGVALASGRAITSEIVVSSADLQTTFGRLVEPSSLPADFAEAVGRFRARGSLYKINLALDGLPRYSAFDAGRAGFPYPSLLRIGPGIRYIEEAVKDAHTGPFSKSPIMVVQTTSAIDPAMAPAGKQVMGILAGFAQYGSGARAEDLLETTLSTLEPYAPGLCGLVLHSQVLGPEALEETFALPGGHVHHGDMSLDQIFIKRPVAGFARYRSPVARLYMCGSSTHPGGGVTGVPGHNAAREILKDRKRRVWG